VGLTSKRCQPYGPCMDRRRFLLTSLAGVLAAPVAAWAQRDMRIDKFMALVVVAYLLAGCGGISPSSAWQACPQGNYAPQSLDEWFRSSSEVIQGRRGPQVEGYIYNNFFAGAEQMLVGVEQLSPSGQAVGCSMVWVSGIVQPGDRAYFVAPVPDASAKYRVRIVAFNWAKKGGP
jgi:hypothetical protein